MPHQRLFVLFAILATCAHAQWLKYPAPGTPRTRGGKPNLAAPALRAADLGERARIFQNLARDLKPDDVVMQPWAKALQARREGSLHTDDLLTECMPPGVPRINMTAGNNMHEIGNGWPAREKLYNLNATTASGGMVTFKLAGRPWKGMSSAITAPALPRLAPPNSSESVLNNSR
jgi:hypothetical protein